MASGMKKKLQENVQNPQRVFRPFQRVSLAGRISFKNRAPPLWNTPPRDSVQFHFPACLQEQSIIRMIPHGKEIGQKKKKKGRAMISKGKARALAGNRTRINCLEGNYADHYTTNASSRTTVTAEILVFQKH